MIRRPPRSTHCISSATSDVYKRQVSNSGQMSVETYLYDFNEEIYGEYVEVSLYSFCRPEMKFSSVEELKQNMARDIEAGREYWKNRRL